MIGAALLIFTLSMDEIAVSFFLIGRDTRYHWRSGDVCVAELRRKLMRFRRCCCVFVLAIVGWYRLRAGSEGRREVAAQLVETV